MPEDKQEPLPLEIDPGVGRLIEAIDITVRIAQHRYGATIDELRKESERTGDLSKLVGIFNEANMILGPEDQFVEDYKTWQETKAAGSHTMGFKEWRLARNEAFRVEYERLQKELSGTS